MTTHLDIDSIRTDGGPVCHACGFRFSPILHRHHVRPRSNGGTNDKDNLVHLCPNCHALVHELYRWGSAKNISELDQKHRNFVILTTWIREAMGQHVFEALSDIATQRHYKRDKRHD